MSDQKKNIVRLISRNFGIYLLNLLYLIIIQFYLDINFNGAYFLPTKLRLRMCLRNV